MEVSPKNAPPAHLTNASQGPTTLSEKKDQTKSLTSLPRRAQDEVSSVTPTPSSTEEVQKLKRGIARLKKDLANGIKREKRLRKKLAKRSEGETAPAHSDEESETMLEEVEVLHSDEFNESNGEL